MPESVGRPRKPLPNVVKAKGEEPLSLLTCEHASTVGEPRHNP
jgi:hypothetical protein